MRYIAQSVLLLIATGLLGCATGEPAATEPERRQAVAVSKALYDAVQAGDPSVVDPAIPWPDDYIMPSDTYEECAVHVHRYEELESYVLMAKAQELCERRHPPDQ